VSFPGLLFHGSFEAEGGHKYITREIGGKLEKKNETQPRRKLGDFSLRGRNRHLNSPPRRFEPWQIRSTKDETSNTGMRRL
jgi:hypothetical protein